MKSILRSFLLIPLFLFVGCVTTTITKPDGTVIKTSSQDPAVVQAVTTGVSQAVISAASAELRRRNNDFK